MDAPGRGRDQWHSGGCRVRACGGLRYCDRRAVHALYPGVYGGRSVAGRIVHLVSAEADWPRRAKELMLTNWMLSADEACEMGVIDRVVPDNDLYDAAMEQAKIFAAADLPRAERQSACCRKSRMPGWKPR